MLQQQPGQAVLKETALLTKHLDHLSFLQGDGRSCITVTGTQCQGGLGRKA